MGGSDRLSTTVSTGGSRWLVCEVRDGIIAKMHDVHS